MNSSVSSVESQSPEQARQMRYRTQTLGRRSERQMSAATWPQWDTAQEPEPCVIFNEGLFPVDSEPYDLTQQTESLAATE